MIDVTLIGLMTAFGAGLLSFLSPCVLPLVPGYLSYVAGTSLEDLRDHRERRVQAAGYATSFVLGFGLVFVILGASATLLGGLLLTWRYELGIVAGLIVALFGLHLLGLLPIAALQRDTRLHLEVPGGRHAGAFVMGLAFAFGWTPCIGPVLGAILTMSAGTGQVGTGVTLLAVYAAGLGLPFLLAALFTDRLLLGLRRLTRLGAALQRGAGALLLGMGVLMVTGQLEVLAFWLLETFPALARLG
jgi:cytochrome c-type biogenesis protein